MEVQKSVAFCTTLQMRPDESSMRLAVFEKTWIVEVNLFQAG